jgi:hypothetical protein
VSEKAKMGIVAHECERETRGLAEECERESEGRDFRRTALVGRGQLVGEGFGEGPIGQIGTRRARGSGFAGELVGGGWCVQLPRASDRSRIPQYYCHLIYAAR